MNQPAEHLDEERIKDTTLLLQSLDIAIERYFLENEVQKIPKTLRFSESDIAELVNDFVETLPSDLLIANGNGYRLLLSILANAYSSIGREDLAELIVRSKKTETVS